jgi:hypothetical protein
VEDVLFASYINMQVWAIKGSGKMHEILVRELNDYREKSRVEDSPQMQAARSIVRHLAEGGGNPEPVLQHGEHFIFMLAVDAEHAVKDAIYVVTLYG